MHAWLMNLLRRFPGYGHRIASPRAAAAFVGALATLGALTAPALAQPRPGAAPAELRMAHPKPNVAPGEQFTVVVSAPSGSPEENRQPLALRWYAAGAAEPVTYPDEVRAPLSGPGRQAVVVRAPYAERLAPDGLYELRLFRCPDACNVPLGSLQVQVSARAPGALVLGRSTFRFGETIEATVTLPTNRYYYGDWFGPSVQLVPLAPDGREAPPDQLAHWSAHCSEGCSARFPDEAFDASLGPNPYDGGRSIRTVDAAGQPRKYTVRLTAPNTAGPYAVRLFDRGWPVDWEQYANDYIDSQPITVGATLPAAAPLGRPVIRGMLVLEEQFAATVAEPPRLLASGLALSGGAQRRESMAYPFSPAAAPAPVPPPRSQSCCATAPAAATPPPPPPPPTPSRTRTLFVWGENLPPQAGHPALNSASPHISYRLASRDIAALTRQGLRLAGTRIPADKKFSTLVVEATLAAGVTPGIQELSIDGAAGSWSLAFNNLDAAIGFVRERDDVRMFSTPAFYKHDKAFVELVYEVDIPFPSIGVRLLRRGRDGRAEVLGVLKARRVDSTTRPIRATYRAGPIHLYDIDGPLPPAPPDGIRLGVRKGDRLAAALDDDHQGTTVPQIAVADIHEAPGDLGPLWREALQRVANCYREPSRVLDDAYSREQATRVSRTLITAWQGTGRKIDLPLHPLGGLSVTRDGVSIESAVRRADHDIVLRKGDHAAAIMVRDEFVRMSRALREEFLEIAASPAAVIAFRNEARRLKDPSRDPFWGYEKARYPEQGMLSTSAEVELWRTLYAAKRPAEFGHPSAADAEHWAIAQTAVALKGLVRRMAAAEVAATHPEVGDCALEKLVDIAGRGAAPVVARIVPRLVRWQAAEGSGRGQWVPHNVARAFVENLAVAGAALRALDELAEADDAYKALAVAAATAGMAFAVQGAGAAAASAVLLAGDATDIAVFGVRSVAAYRQGEQRYRFALGASAVFGRSLVDEAEAGRRSGMMTAVGLIAPALSGAAGLRQLRDLQAVERGRDLVASGRVVPQQFGRSNDPRLESVAAYYMHLATRVESRGVASLNGSDRSAFAAFRAFLEPSSASTTLSTRSDAVGTVTVVRGAEGATTTASTGGAIRVEANGAVPANAARAARTPAAEVPVGAGASAQRAGREASTAVRGRGAVGGRGARGGSGTGAGVSLGERLPDARQLMAADPDPRLLGRLDKRVDPARSEAFGAYYDELKNRVRAHRKAAGVTRKSPKAIRDATDEAAVARFDQQDQAAWARFQAFLARPGAVKRPGNTPGEILNGGRPTSGSNARGTWVALTYRVGDPINRMTDLPRTAKMEGFLPKTKPGMDRAHMAPPEHGVNDPAGLAYLHRSVNQKTDREFEKKIRHSYEQATESGTNGSEVHVTVVARRNVDGSYEKTWTAELRYTNGESKTFLDGAGYRVDAAGRVTEIPPG